MIRSRDIADATVTSVSAATCAAEAKPGCKRVGFKLDSGAAGGKTAFLAERVLGNVVSSGVKVLVLAVVIGIGSTLFAEFTHGFGANQPSVEDAMAIVLAALSLPWSTGPVEGHITRLKLIKRQGYGRAGLDTLKRRFLRAA